LSNISTTLEYRGEIYPSITETQSKRNSTTRVSHLEVVSSSPSCNTPQAQRPSYVRSRGQGGHTRIRRNTKNIRASTTTSAKLSPLSQGCSSCQTPLPITINKNERSLLEDIQSYKDTCSTNESVHSSASLYRRSPRRSLPSDTIKKLIRTLFEGSDLYESEDENSQKSSDQSYIYVDDESTDNEDLVDDNEELGDDNEELGDDNEEIGDDNEELVHDNDVSVLGQEGESAINFSIPLLPNANSSRLGNQFGTNIIHSMYGSEDALRSSGSDDDVEGSFF